jgi:hypothetical protein
MPRFGKSGTCAALLLAAVTLTACELTATGSGAVTITFDEPATAFNGTSPYGVALGKTGDILAFCEAGVVCLPDTPGLIKYWYKPAAGDTQGVVTVGSLVLDPDGNTVPLPAGSYRAEGIRFLYILGPAFLHTGTTDFTIGGSSPDMSTSMQSTARVSVDATCSSGWSPSWAQWPNNGKGGYVCDRWIYIYYPDLPVPTQKQASQVQPWRQEIGRSSSQASCPAGYDPAWSQWPNNNTGGHVCARDVVS